MSNLIPEQRRLVGHTSPGHVETGHPMDTQNAAWGYDLNYQVGGNSMHIALTPTEAQHLQNQKRIGGLR